MAKILIVEDEINARDGLDELLKGEGFDVEIADNGRTALQKLDQTVDVLLSDLKIPGIMGLELIAHAAKKYPEIIAIVMTGYNEPERQKNGKEIGIYAWLTKPLDIDALLALLRRVACSSKVPVRKQILT